jgi:hypothetical protein
LQGHTLFQTHDNREHLAMMEKILARSVPTAMTRRTRSKYFDGHLRLLWDAASAEARYTNQHCRPLHAYRRHAPDTNVGRHETAMLDLVARMLEYEPAARIALRDALRHHFFDGLSFQLRMADDVARHILRLQI